MFKHKFGMTYRYENWDCQLDWDDCSSADEQRGQAEAMITQASTQEHQTEQLPGSHLEEPAACSAFIRSDGFLYISNFLCLFINRPGVAGAVLQAPSWLGPDRVQVISGK